MKEKKFYPKKSLTSLLHQAIQFFTTAYCKHPESPFDFSNCVFIILSCLLPVPNKADAAEVDPLLESQSDGGTLLGSSQISATEDYWFFANRVTNVVWEK